MKYERVTRKDGVIWEEDYTLTDLHNRLFDLENAIEAGTLIELPCKVGDTVWWLLNKKDIVKDICKSIALRTNNNEIRWCINGAMLDDTTIFLTKAEAEARLKELRGEL